MLEKKNNNEKENNKEIYLDHAATTYLDSRVFDVMKPYFSEEFGNPSSFNSVGMRAKETLSQCRKNVAKLLNAKSKEIIFTGSGTESVNLAIQGVARANKKIIKGNGVRKKEGTAGKKIICNGHIITSQIEHHAVLDTCEYLEKEEGFDVTYLKPDKFGVVSAKQVKEALREDTILVTIMYANNEVGTINPISEISKVVKFTNPNTVFHTDACQAGGILDVNVEKLGVDLMTLNGSKLYGPKGTGMLYIRNGTKIKPLIFGGGQEFGIRSGTENLPGIVGFTKALDLAQENREAEVARLTKLRDKLVNDILDNVSDTVLNGHSTKRLPNNANISFLNVEGESLLLHLNEQGICASSGSACTSKDLEPSHVLVAMGLPYELAHGSIRFTLGKRTIEEEIDKVISVLPEIVKTLRIISPFNERKENFENKK